MNDRFNDKDASRRLKECEERYRMLVDLAVDAFFQGDRDGNFISVNEKVAELTGYSKEELMKMKITDIFPESSPFASHFGSDETGAGLTRRAELEILCKDGRRILADLRYRVMPDGTCQSCFTDITERRTAEKAVAESEIKYRNLHMSLMDGYVFVDMQGKVIDSNVAYQQMLGYDADELSRLSYFDLTPSKWHDYENTIVNEQILTYGHSVVYHKEYVKKDGTVFPVELRTFLVKDESGCNAGMWAIVRDISARLHAEETLRKSEQKFRSIVESSPNGMHFYELDSNDDLIFLGANPAADIMLGIAHDGLIGKTIYEVFPNLSGTGIPEMYKKVALGETGLQSFDSPYQDDRFSGYYSVHVFRTGTRSITVDFSDITRRRETEEALLHSEIEYRDTLNSIPDWIYVIDAGNKIAMANDALKKEFVRFGLNPDCIGMEITTSFPFISKTTLDEIKEVFATGTIAVNVRQCELKDEKIHAEITRVPILKDNVVIKVILMVRNRSKEHEIEELKSRNAEQKEVLLREIHHRVKNNLAIVISLLNFQLKNNTNEELTRMIIDIQMRIRSMALIHEHLYRSDNLDRIPLAAYVDSLASIVLTAFSGHRITLVKDLEPMDVNIETALPIGLIINELLTNAFKYAFPGSRPGEILIRLVMEEGQMCLLVVEDNGVGLPDSTSMDSEKSLGLYIVKLLTEQLDGNVKIIRNNGTAFHIRFLNMAGQKKAGPRVKKPI